MYTLHYWDWIERNMIEFGSGLDKGKSSLAVKRFKQFSHWYYHPALDIFAPSKFIGYEENTHENYYGFGNGGDTQKLLSRFFDPVPEEEYKLYLQKLINYASQYGLQVNEKTIYGQYGWIYTPNKEVMNVFIEPKSIVDTDIRSFENEFVDLPSNLEGASKSRLVNQYERNPKLRKAAILYHGTTCAACKFNFEQYYGEHGKDFIEVHHIVPLSKVKDQHNIDPRNDLIVVCSNCHRMIHRDQKKPLTLQELIQMIKN